MIDICAAHLASQRPLLPSNLTGIFANCQRGRKQEIHVSHRETEAENRRQKEAELEGLASGSRRSLKTDCQGASDPDASPPAPSPFPAKTHRARAQSHVGSGLIRRTKPEAWQRPGGGENTGLSSVSPDVQKKSECFSA